MRERKGRKRERKGERIQPHWQGVRVATTTTKTTTTTLTGLDEAVFMCSAA